MGSYRHGVPVELAELLRDDLGLRGAIETGTFLGDSAITLSKYFSQVWSIELSEPLWQAAKSRHQAAEGVTFELGSSVDVLPALLQEVQGPLLFWLDGHWSGGETAGVDNECPVLAEIAAVDASAEAGRAVILMDDARLFLSPPPPPHNRDQWPGLMEVTDMLRAKHDRFVTIIEDVVVAVPASSRRVVEDYSLASAASAETKRPPKGWRRLVSR